MRRQGGYYTTRRTYMREAVFETCRRCGLRRDPPPLPSPFMTCTWYVIQGRQTPVLYDLHGLQIMFPGGSRTICMIQEHVSRVGFEFHLIRHKISFRHI